MKKNRIIILSILSVLFISLIILIKTNLINPLDNFIYKIITFRISGFITWIMKIFTFFGSTLFIVSLTTLIVLYLFFIKKERKKAISIASVIIISTIINNVVKIIICRERPEVLKLVIENTYSFPSGHSMAAVSLYGYLLYLVNKYDFKKVFKIILSIIFVILPILIMISRIYLGAHYFSDVIGAMILSIILLIIEISIMERYEFL